MHRALVSVIFAGLIFAGLIASAQAHQKNTPPGINTEASTQVSLQKSTEVIKVRAQRTVPDTVDKSSDPSPSSGWGKYGTLLATLVVMCAIALRRQRLGRS